MMDFSQLGEYRAPKLSPRTALDYGSGIPGLPGSQPHFSLQSSTRRKVTTAPTETLGSMGFAGWFESRDPQDAHTGKRVYPTASGSSAPALREPVIVTKSGPYLNRRLVGSPSKARAMDVAEDQSLVYRRHLGGAPLPTIPDRVERKRFLPDPTSSGGASTKQHGVRKTWVPSNVGEEFESPSLPHLRRVDGRWITYSNQDKEQTLEETLNHRRHVLPEHFYGRGLAGDLSKRTGPPPRVEMEQGLYKNQVDDPTFVRFAQNLKPVPGPGCTERRELQAQRRAVDEVNSLRKEVAGLDTWGRGKGEMVAVDE